MKTTYSFVVYAWADCSNSMTCLATYSTRSLAFSHARELYYVGTYPVFVVAYPRRTVSPDYVPKIWTCIATPRVDREVVISRCSIVEFLSYIN